MLQEAGMQAVATGDVGEQDEQQSWWVTEKVERIRASVVYMDDLGLKMGSRSDIRLSPIRSHKVLWWDPHFSD